MLQQTQVATVIPYFERFMERFPTVESLAIAPIDDVLSLWSGLGYYRRAHFIHRSAQLMHELHNAQLPNDLETLMSLPGIGRSTAGAILSQGYQISAPILDGNVKRVLARMFGIEGWPDQSANLKKLWALSEQLTPTHQVDIYTQGMMDIGATVCAKSAKCGLCPLSEHCVAHSKQLQAVIPGKKPKKEKPTRLCQFALISNAEGKILMHKRPDTGIWSSLWSLPCMESDTNPYSEHGVARVLDEGIWMRHTFSHFHLEYKMVKMRQTKSFEFSAQEQQWISLSQALKLGLPKPIRSLIEGELSCQTKEMSSA